MPPIRDVYDDLPPARAAELRRRNKKRLAQLEAEAPARRARLALAVEAVARRAGREGG